MRLEGGKYQGEDIEDVAYKDPSYLLFIVKNSGFHSSIKLWIKQHFNELWARAIEINPNYKGQ